MAGGNGDEKRMPDIDAVSRETVCREVASELLLVWGLLQSQTADESLACGDWDREPVRTRTDIL